MEGSHKGGRAEGFTVGGTEGTSCWKTLGAFIEPALNFPLWMRKRRVLSLPLPIHGWLRAAPETPQAENHRLILDATGMQWSGECPGTMDRGTEEALKILAEINTYYKTTCLLNFIYLATPTACGILVPQPDIEHMHACTGS